MIKLELSPIFLLIIATFVVENVEAQKYLTSVYEWRYVDYQFPSQTIKDDALRRGVFQYGSPFLLDIDVYYGSSGTTYFVTMPRFYNGTAITLGTITNIASSSGGPLIAPFPDYNWQQAGNCNGFTNVFRVYVDGCHRLWVLDSGVIDDKQVCPAKLVIFNLKTMTLDRTHIFSNTLYRAMSLFVTPVVDSRSCTDSKAYIADVTGFGLIVYDYYSNRSWRAQSSGVHLTFDSRYTTFKIGGESFVLEDGVFGLALSPINYSNRQLFFHSLASYSESRIPLSYLDNPANWPTSNPIMYPNPFVTMNDRQYTQSTVQAMDANGNLFFGLINPPGIGCWDSNLAYIPANLKIVSRDDTQLQFISGLKIVNTAGGQELWVLSCRFQKIMNGRSTSEVNYRVKKIKIYELLNNSYRCNGPIIPSY